MTLEYDSTIERSCHYPHPHDKTASEYPVPSSDYATELEKHESGLTFATFDLVTSYTHSWPKDFDMLKEVIKGLPTLDDRQVSENTHLLLLAFQKMLAMNRSMIESSRYLPPLRFRRLDDGTALIEWIFKDFRTGFTIEKDERESGWYLVSNRNLNETSESGSLVFREIDSLLSKLLSYVMSNT